MSTRFANKTALVTGGSRGIGRAIARALHAEGARVAIACRDVDVGPALVDELTRGQRSSSSPSPGSAPASGAPTAMVVGCDVGRGEDVERAVREVERVFGAVHVLVNAAGTEGERGAAAVTEVDDDEWDAVLDVNLKGAFRVSRAVLPAMVKAGGGAIVHIASIGGVEALARAAPYVASKTGLVGLTRSMALDYAPHGVRVSCVCPGVVETDMMARQLAHHENPHKLRMQITSLHPLGRIGAPDDVAPAVLFLASDEARWITGVTLTVDGGYTLRRFATAPPEL